MNPEIITKQKLTNIVEAIDTLGITGEKLYYRIIEDYNRGLITEARRQLDIFDKLLEAAREKCGFE